MVFSVAGLVVPTTMDPRATTNHHRSIIGDADIEHSLSSSPGLCRKAHSLNRTSSRYRLAALDSPGGPEGSREDQRTDLARVLEQVQRRFRRRRAGEARESHIRKVPAKARATVALDESNSSGSGHDYFQFMAKCM